MRITVEVMTQKLTEEIIQAKTAIKNINNKWTQGDLTDTDRISYYESKKVLCEYACNFSRNCCNFDEQKRFEKRFQSAWRMYNQLRREKATPTQ